MDQMSVFYQFWAVYYWNNNTEQKILKNERMENTKIELVRRNIFLLWNKRTSVHSSVYRAQINFFWVEHFSLAITRG